MESFFRYIAYVDYYKKGQKISNVGFLKWRYLYKGHEVEIKLNGLPKVKKACSIMEIRTGKKIGNIILEQGMGYFEKKFPIKQASGEDYVEIENERLYLRDIQGFEVEIETEEYLKIEVDFEKELNQKIITLDENNVEENYEIAQYAKDSMSNVKNKITFIEEKTSKPDGEIRTLELEKNVEIMKPIPEDKWEQLCMEYPKVLPFKTNRIFLSIKPKDFIILREDCQKKVNNSFLLHGFYNYGHMILGKLSEEKTSPIYIGVPGVYYEREKQAAQMFGFVGFESTEDPVQSGSYGYYMMEVNI